MTAKTVAQVKALHASGQNIFRRQSVDVLLARIAELEAENARLKAAQGCEYCGAVGDAQHGEYCRTWKGGDA